MSDHELCLHRNSAFSYREDVMINIPIGIFVVDDPEYPDGARIKLVRPTEGAEANSRCFPEDFKVLHSHRINDILEKTGACYAVIVLDRKSYSPEAAMYLKNLQQASLDFLIPNSSPVIRTSISCHNQPQEHLLEYFVFPSTPERRVKGTRFYMALLTYISRQIIFFYKGLKELDQCAAMRNIVRTLQAILPGGILSYVEGSPELPLDKLPDPATEPAQVCLHESMCCFLRLLDAQRRKEALRNPGVCDREFAPIMCKALVTLCGYVNMIVKNFNEKLAAQCEDSEVYKSCKLEDNGFISMTNFLEKVLVPYIKVPTLPEPVK